MRNLHIIMPMAGEGSRFLKEGFNTPKPLILFKGKPLFQRAISCITTEVDVPMKYSFIVRKEHIDKYNIDQEIKKVFPESTIFSVEKTTRGAVETCMLAKDAINREDAVLILDCDLEFYSEAYNKSILEVLLKPVEEVEGGILVSFNSSEARYSYAVINDQYEVVRTAEKEVISQHALCGAYFFSKADSFLFAAEALLHQINFDKPEYYISLLYNYLLNRGEIVKLVKVDQFYSYGTPEEIMKYI